MGAKSLYTDERHKAIHQLKPIIYQTGETLINQ